MFSPGVLHSRFKTMLVFRTGGGGGKQGVLREICKWRILNNRFTLFSLNCQKMHSSTSFLVTFHVIFIAFYPPIKKKEMHWPGIDPGPPAWQARILPLNHQCLADD